MLSAALWAELTFDRFFRGLTEGVQGQRGEWSAAEITLWGLLAVGAAAALAGAYHWFIVRPRQTKASTPAALFEKLCQVHGLSPAEVALLNDLVRQERVALPPRIFLEPERFEAGRRGGPPGNRSAELAALRAKLFAGAE